ncbi:MAG: PIN domain-containing protein [Verrucomicrobia bacterium]|nr:PIN domain-containing protein [Verrucomicrobiota bacterium]
MTLAEERKRARCGLERRATAGPFGRREIARTAPDGEVVLTPDLADWLDDLAHRFRVWPVTPQIAWRSVAPDWAHEDPVDRLIVATALEHQLTLVTHDKEISRWGDVPVLW